MKLRQLEAIRAVIATGTTTNAAEMMLLTQSAVSRLITELERELDFKLFDRRHGRLALTSDGEIFFHEAETVLAGMDRMAATAKDIQSQQAGSIRIVSMPALSYGLLSPAVAAFSRAHPKVRISVDVVGQREQIQKRVAGGQFDIGLVTLPVDQEDVAIEHLFAVDGVCITPQGHRLAGKAKVTAQDLADEPFVSVDPGTRLRGRVDDLFRALGVRRLLSVEAQTSVMVCHLVADGAGVSLVHPFVATALRGKLTAIPFEPALRFDYGLVFPRSRARPKITQTLTDILKRQAKELVA